MSAFPIPAQDLTSTSKAIASPIPSGGGDAGSGEDGLKIILTPVQLAAILVNSQITAHEMLINRVGAFGNLLVVAAQLAGALLATPEPTMLTKVTGSLLAAHGFDQGQAAVRQLWTGQTTEDFTQKAGEASARVLGASERASHLAGVGLDTASSFALGLEVAVPL